MNWKTWIQELQDFPKSGVSFKDISPLLRSGHFPVAVGEMRDLVELPDYWVGIDSSSLSDLAKPSSRSWPNSCYAV
jgi:adenine/guanine phosphoribosyltransferase-like PRPP-binding protein